MDDKMDMDEIYRATLEKWGVDAQYDQAVEECAELITALKHFRRGKISGEKVIEELADVHLMLGQLTYMFGREKVSAAINDKINKLNRLMSKP